MGGGIYRDPLEAVLARVREREAEVADREGRVTDALLAALPRPLVMRLASLRASRSRRRGALTLDDLAQAEDRLAAYRDALDEALALAPAVEEELRALPRTVADPVLVRGDLPRTNWETAIDVVAPKLEGVVSLRDPRAQVERRPYEDLVIARFRVDNAPFSLVCGCGDPEVPNALATSVARGAPWLEVRPETYGRTFMKMLGLVRDIRVGDPSFDGLFIVDAETDVAQRYLTRPVRHALLELAYFDVPTLRVEPGMATLRWRFEPEGRALAEAVRALLHLRMVPVRVGLV